MKTRPHPLFFLAATLFVGAFTLVGFFRGQPDDSTVGSPIVSGPLASQVPLPVAAFDVAAPADLERSPSRELLEKAEQELVLVAGAEIDHEVGSQPDLKTQFLGGIANARRSFEEGVTSPDPAEQIRVANTLLVVSIAAILEATGQGEVRERGTRTLTRPTPGTHYFSLNGRSYSIDSHSFPEYVELWSLIVKPKSDAPAGEAQTQGPNQELLERIRARSDEALMWAAAITK